MNVAEGARRMQMVGRCMNLTGATFLVLYIVLMISMQFSSWGLHNIMAPLAPVLVFALPLSMLLVLVGGVLWMAAWIVAGFAQPRLPRGIADDRSSAATSR